MFAVAGVSGNTGSAVARTLLAHKQSVRVIVREETKGDRWRQLGAEVALARVEDAEAMARALEGVRGAYLLIPPDLTSTDPLGRARRIVDALCAAVRRSGVPHVTALSSIAAHLPEGTGIVRSAYELEQGLSQLNVGVTFLRACYFMENWASSLPMALQQGMLGSFLAPAERKIPMVATQDIGLLSAYSLMFGAPAKRVIELAGPEDYSPADVAAALTRLTGRTTNVAVAPVESMAPMLTSFGMSTESALLMAELIAGVNSGHVAWQGQGALLLRGTTPLDQTLGKLLESQPAA